MQPFKMNWYNIKIQVIFQRGVTFGDNKWRFSFPYPPETGDILTDKRAPRRGKLFQFQSQDGPYENEEKIFLQ